VTESDDLLLERLKQGDQSAFEALFHRHYRAVYGSVYRLMGSREAAEDLAQETFLALYHQPPSVTATSPLIAWLCRVALNRGYNAHRGEQRERQRVDRWASLPQTDDPHTVAAQREDRAHVQAALARLPERQGKLLLMRHAGLSYAEISAALGIAPGSVGTLLARAERAFLEVYRVWGRLIKMTHSW